MSTYGLAQMVEEICRRDPHYLQRHPLNFGPLEANLPHVEGTGNRTSAGTDLWTTLGTAVEHLRAAGWARAEAGSRSCILAGLFLDTVADAWAEPGLVDGLKGSEGSQPIKAILDHGFGPVSLPGHPTFYRRKAGLRDVLLVNAGGIDLSVWSRLLGDETHDFRLFMAEDVLGSGDTVISLDEQVEAIHRSVRDLGISQFDILAWSNGARVAIELAARAAGAVEHLILVAPDLDGVAGFEALASAHATNLEALFGTVIRNPAQAALVSRLAASLWGAPALCAPGTAENIRVDALLRSPPADRISALAAPMASAEAVLRYALRSAEDRRHDTVRALGEVSAKILLVTGEHDAVCSNVAARSVLRAAHQAYTEVEVTGAGHLPHDLQYPYFRYAASKFLSGESIKPLARARNYSCLKDKAD